MFLDNKFMLVISFPYSLGGGIGRRKGLKIPRSLVSVRVRFSSQAPRISKGSPLWRTSFFCARIGHCTRIDLSEWCGDIEVKAQDQIENEQSMPLNSAQPQNITLLYTTVSDSLPPHCLRDVEDVKDTKERQAADFGQVDERASICYGNVHCSNAHARSSIIALCSRSANSTQSMPTASTASSRGISPRR